MLNPTTCSADTLTLWSFLPQFVQDNDEAGGYQFLTWLDGICSQQQVIDDLCRDGSLIGWSSILDVTRCPTYALPWLGQFLGTRFSGSILNDDAAMREAITAKGSFNRGTTASIISAVTPFLGPGGYVNVIERYPDAYSLTVQINGALGALTYAELARKEGTYAAVATEYPIYSDFSGSQSEQTITAAVQAAIPGGIVATIVFE